jgi:hypothetical protein
VSQVVPSAAESTPEYQPKSSTFDRVQVPPPSSVEYRRSAESKILVQLVATSTRSGLATSIDVNSPTPPDAIRCVVQVFPPSWLLAIFSFMSS